MARRPIIISDQALTALQRRATAARRADARASEAWAAVYAEIDRAIAAREMTIAAAATALAVTEPTLKRALATYRVAASRIPEPPG